MAIATQRCITNAIFLSGLPIIMPNMRLLTHLDLNLLSLDAISETRRSARADNLREASVTQYKQGTKPLSLTVSKIFNGECDAIG